MGIRIDELNPASPSKAHELPAMKEGLTGKFSIGQILKLTETEDVQGLSEALAEKASGATSINVEGLASGGGDLSSDLTISVPKASTAQAEARSDDAVALTPLSGDKMAAAREARVLHMRDQKSSGSSGGASIAGTQVRTLNTVVTNGITGASLSSSVVTLPAGTYDVDISCPAYKADHHRASLRVSGGGAVLLVGQQGYSGSSDTVASLTVIRGRLTLAGLTSVEVAHHTNAAFAPSGLGPPATDGGVCVFTEALFRKVD